MLLTGMCVFFFHSPKRIPFYWWHYLFFLPIFVVVFRTRSGKGGSKIKEIRESTGCSIQVASDMLPNSTEREVKLTGTAEQITQCIFHICCVMLEVILKLPPFCFFFSALLHRVLSYLRIFYSILFGLLCGIYTFCIIRLSRSNYIL